jgi:hypothetical protein
MFKGLEVSSWSFTHYNIDKMLSDSNNIYLISLSTGIIWKHDIAGNVLNKIILEISLTRPLQRNIGISCSNEVNQSSQFYLLCGSYGKPSQILIFDHFGKQTQQKKLELKLQGKFIDIKNNNIIISGIDKINQWCIDIYNINNLTLVQSFQSSPHNYITMDNKGFIFISKLNGGIVQYDVCSGSIIAILTYNKEITQLLVSEMGEMFLVDETLPCGFGIYNINEIRNINCTCKLVNEINLNQQYLITRDKNVIYIYQ